MELRKNPKVSLEGKRPLFMSVGLCISLGFMLVAFEWKSELQPIMAFETHSDDFEELLDIPLTEHEPPEPPKPKIIQPVIVESEEPIIEEELVIDFGEEFDSPIDDLAFTVVEEPEEAPEFVDFAEEMPVPKGGMKAFYEYLGKHMNYPRSAISIGIEGKVFVQFIVEKDGTLSNVHVVKGIHDACDAEAARVIKSYPSWTPGKQGHRPVRVRMMMPIYFKLNH